MKTLARIATVCQGGRGQGSIEANRSHMLGLLERALLQKPDVVCLPEAFLKMGLSGVSPDRVVEPVPGPTIDAVAKLARKCGCYVICPLRTLRDGRHWNSAVIIGRSGEVVGQYDKLHPVTTSPDYTVFESGISPGADLPVFDLDFGRIGIQICFDAGFPETWQALADRGVKAIFWPSAYDGGFRLQALAALHQVHVITSVRTERSRIIDPCGRVQASTDRFAPIAVRDVNLDFEVCHYDFNCTVPQRLLDAYPGRVRIASYSDDPCFLVEPMDAALTMERLRSEFGIEGFRQYHDRHREAYSAVLAGQTPPVQTARHGSRAMYAD